MNRDEAEVTVLCGECGTYFLEEEVKFLNIEEDFMGRDQLTFECPECGKEMTSFRYG